LFKISNLQITLIIAVDRQAVELRAPGRALELLVFCLNQLLQGSVPGTEFVALATGSLPAVIGELAGLQETD